MLSRLVLMGLVCVICPKLQAQNDLGQEFYLGKWKSCLDIKPAKQRYKIDKNKSCSYDSTSQGFTSNSLNSSNTWTYNFKSDGKFEVNKAVKSVGRAAQKTEKEWKLIDKGMEMSYISERDTSSITFSKIIRFSNGNWCAVSKGYSINMYFYFTRWEDPDMKQ